MQRFADRAALRFIHYAVLAVAGLATSLAQATPDVFVLDSIARATAQPATQTPIRISLGNRDFTLVPSTAHHNEAVGANVMRGGLAGEPGRFVLAEVDGYVAGAVWTDSGTIEFRPVGNRGEVRVIDIDNADLPACATLGLAHPAVPFAPIDDQTTRGEPEQIVRVFVGITRAGEIQMGGPSGAVAVAAAAVASANTSYANSAMTVGDNGAVQCQLELVGTFTVDPGPGLGASGLLGALRSTTDGVMDELHILRDASGADLVSLLSESGIGACGIAYLSPYDPTRGFSVTSQSCAVGNLSFAHELGHNLGASHDAANAGSGWAAYGFGWRWTTSGGSFRRSVMAYSPGSRRPNFSNPGILDGGTPTGNAQQADNARLIGETFPSVASFRTGTGGGAGDCDGNGTPDLLEILDNPTLDTDESGTLDTCDVQNGLLEDCNGDGLADIGQTRPRIDLNPEPILLSGFPPYEATVNNLVEAFTDAEITLVADANLGAANEYIDIAINGVPQGRLWETDGEDCDPTATNTVLTFTPAEWASFGPDVTLTVTRPAAVGGGCSSNSLSVNIAYTGINRDFDADGDGVLDACSPACNDADLAEPFGTLDLADIGAFVAAFTGQEPSGDLDNNGVFDLADISLFVGAFNTGCS